MILKSRLGHTYVRKLTVHKNWVFQIPFSKLLKLPIFPALKLLNMFLLSLVQLGKLCHFLSRFCQVNFSDFPWRFEFCINHSLCGLIFAWNITLLAQTQKNYRIYSWCSWCKLIYKVIEYIHDAADANSYLRLCFQTFII